MTFDSLLFDMDGTLWDAVDSYCAVWNRTAEEFGLRIQPVTRARLSSLMGTPLEGIFDQLIGNHADHDAFIRRLAANEASMMPTLGGILYPGVREGLHELKKTHRLFMVSNCDASGLPNFVKFTGLEGVFTDLLSWGATQKDKEENIRYLVERYTLTSPLYIGDTAGDCASSHRAGVPFAWASYGFGRNVADADYTLNSFADLISLCKK